MLSETFTEWHWPQWIYLIPVACLSLWFVWRLWRFTIRPVLYPNDPQELPYWVPIFGHARAFFQNSQDLLNYARHYYGDTREPFALHAIGVKIYVLTRASDIVEAYKNTSTFSFDIFVQGLMRSTGSSERVVDLMYRGMDKEKAGFANPTGKPLAHLAINMHRNQLYPGKNLEYLSDQFVEYFDKHLGLESIIANRRYASSIPDEKGVVLPLSTWTSDFVVCAGQKAYFGETLAKIDPNFTWKFIEYDELAWQVLYQYPAFLSRQMHAARDHLTASIQKYFDTPPDERAESAWFVRAMELEMRGLGMSSKELAPMMAVIYWAINTNTRRACFWMLAYISHHPTLIPLLRAETAAAFPPTSSKPNIAHLTDRCPLLTSTWLETLRLTAFSASVRYVTRDTTINGYVLRKGGRVMIPYRQLHFDAAVFGAAADGFDPRRFLDAPKLDRASTWRPFGGGETMCPGRFVAKCAVVSFVAMVLQRFEVELEGRQRFPRTDDSKPVVGMVSAREGEDVLLRVRAREGRVKGCGGE